MAEVVGTGNASRRPERSDATAKPVLTPSAASICVSAMAATTETPACERFRPVEAREIVRTFDLKELLGDFFADPFPYYHALREHDPVHRMPDGAYLLTRYADCEAVYKDARTFSSDKKVEFKPKYGNSPLFEHHTTSLVFNDPPLHTHVRRAIMAAL